MYIADLHIHSRFSRATSRDLTPAALDLWARRKGIQVLGTGDFTHPAWREELKEQLQPAEDGLYILKDGYRIKDGGTQDSMIPRFAVTGEISSIYKKNGRVRKVHSLIILPGLDAAELISKKLETIGNIHSDGRPILGLDCRDLLEITLDLCPQAIYVPAHIWTPHFSLFGAFSGFDTVEECFGDLSPYIHAMETGLSSDPPMNWRISALDKYQLISNSDAHSASKLGREANLLSSELSYSGLKCAVEQGIGLDGTIEFFPEEGKYHMDGHRKCNLCLKPSDTEKYGGICPVCGKKITIGVSHRVEQLADRPECFIKENAKRFESLVPLPEVIAASIGKSAASAKVNEQYLKMTGSLGAEFEILRNIPIEDIKKCSGSLIAEGIDRLRHGKVERIPGFDGEYGIIKLFGAGELNNVDGQMDFFSMLGLEAEHRGQKEDAEVSKAADGTTEVSKAADGTLKSVRQKASQESRADNERKIDDGTKINSEIKTDNEIKAAKDSTPQLNTEQAAAVYSQFARTAVIAGPGTGKTKTLVSKIVYLIETRRVKPSEITAVTFTNQAASEMKERISRQLGKRNLKGMQIGTFHSLCLNLLKEHGTEFSLADESQTIEYAGDIVREYGIKLKGKKFLEKLSLYKSEAVHKEGVDKKEREELLELQAAFEAYEKLLRQNSQMDFDDLLIEALKLSEQGLQTAGLGKNCFNYLLVDEFQDINPLQYKLIKAWHSLGRELFVIGDPDQSIYGFRGAQADCFDRLKEDYTDTEVIGLVQNYRSSPQILKAALKVISENPGKERILLPHSREGAPVRLVSVSGEMAEAIFTAKEIGRLVGGVGMLEAHEEAYRNDGRPLRGFDDIAVLYRTHRQADLLEKCLKQEGIPYVVAGRDEFLQAPSVGASLNFFKYLENPSDISLKAQCLKTLWKLEMNPLSESIFDAAVNKFQPIFEKKKPQKFMEVWIKEMQMENDSAMNKLSGMMVFYNNMKAFMEAVRLGVESDIKRCGSKEYSSGAVTLMTLHGSKGLEFPVTIIYGVKKGMIPFESETKTADTEEERRLFYVGMTRAKEELIMTASGEVSEFLSGVDSSLIVREKGHKPKADSGYRQMSLFE